MPESALHMPQESTGTCIYPRNKLTVFQLTPGFFGGAAAPEIAIIATRGDAVGALAGGSQLGDFGEFIGEFIHDTTS